MAAYLKEIASEPQPRRRAWLPLAMLAALTIVGAWPAEAAELIMFEQAGCPFCARFDAEIAPDYPKSRAGRIAPLRRVDIHEDRTGGIEGLEPAVFTPTFVVVDDDGREIGRLLGYPGRKYFYPEIEALLSGLKPAGDSVSEFPTARSPAGDP